MLPSHPGRAGAMARRGPRSAPERILELGQCAERCKVEQQGRRPISAATANQSAMKAWIRALIPTVPLRPVDAILSTGSLGSCSANSKDGAVEEPIYPVPLAGWDVGKMNGTRGIDDVEWRQGLALGVPTRAKYPRDFFLHGT